MEHPEAFEIQIIYTQIDEDAQGKPVFTDYYYQLDNLNYFYPASSIKLPVAVLALEFIDKNRAVSVDSNYLISGDSLQHSIRNDIAQIFSVSDNQAYNRLYELLGRDYVNTSMHTKGLEPFRLAHRVETDWANNPRRDSLDFDGDLILGGGIDSPISVIDAKKLYKGTGFIRNDSLVEGPMDFSEKNYFPLETQHQLMKRIFFEELYTEKERFQLTPTSKSLLFKAMHTVPRKQGYNEAEFYDGYGKFFIYGDTKDRIQDNIKIYNKVGFAYGTLTDTAYITDDKNGVRFLLSGTILVNENGIFNDGIYEYETIGLPFLAQLGRELYNLELTRNR